MNELANKLEDMAAGNGPYVSALVDALDFKNLTQKNKRMLWRYLHGDQTENDMHDLHTLAVALRRKN